MDYLWHNQALWLELQRARLKCNDNDARWAGINQPSAGHRLVVIIEFIVIGAQLPDLFRHIPECQSPTFSNVIRGDSARPEIISHLKKHSFVGIRAAEKWAGSVQDGVSFLRGLDSIVIHPRCKETIIKQKTKALCHKMHRGGGLNRVSQQGQNR